jgi:hypothetical protein
MADEQTIYVSPEDELTSVRERLERTQARRITLIIPQQTSLRSHVGWRLIHARMRELGKDLLVISVDRQVRAVARAAGFRVAETQEPSGSRLRSDSSSHTGTPTTRGSAHSRTGSSRSGAQSRGSQPAGGRRRLAPGPSRPVQLPPTPVPQDYTEETTLERPRRSASQPAGNQAPTPTALFGPSHDFRINTTPPLPPTEDEEDEESNYDYHIARGIRESASGASLPAQEHPLTREADESRASAASRWNTDPYAHFEEEEQHTRLHEQRGSVHSPLDELDIDTPDISDRSTEIIADEIEDLGDMGDLDLPQITPAAQEESPPPYPRQRSRTEQPPSASRRSPLAPRADLTDDDELLALPDISGQASSARVSRDLSSARPRQSQQLRPEAMPAASTQARRSQALTAGTAPPSPRPRVAPPPVAAASRTPNRQLIATPSASTNQRRPRPARRGNRSLVILFTTVVALLVIALLLLYLIPTATVTISLRARTLSQTVELNATTNPAAPLANKVAAQVLQHDFSVNGSATASDTTRVGNATARGLVTLTNNGSAQIIVPSGILVTTASGIPFATDAEAAVGPQNSYPAVPVKAQQAGEIGNVAVNTITVIPPASLARIAQYNHTSPSTLNLTVKNLKATSGGGATNVPAVAARDQQALLRRLHTQLQAAVTTWLAGQLHTGDVRGTLTPDVLKSANPLPGELLSGAPQVGQPVINGTFPGTLVLHTSVLVVRASALQEAAGAQLNAAAARSQPASMLAIHLPVTLSIRKSTPSQDGTSLAISAKASGEIIQQLSSQALSNALTGKGVGQVISDLKASLAQAGVQNVQVSVSPSFLTIMPLQAGRIQVVLQPVTQDTPGNVPNG